MEEGFEDTDRTRNCMMIILILLVIITILFELCCNWQVPLLCYLSFYDTESFANRVMKEVSEFMKPVVLILFKVCLKPLVFLYHSFEFLFPVYWRNISKVMKLIKEFICFR
jgi:polyferredoxin